MLKNLIPFLLCGAFSSLIAQPYKLIHPERQYVFAFDDGLQTAYDRVIHADTVFVSGMDTVYKNYPVMMTSGGGSACLEYTNQGPGWLGKYVIEKPGGDYLLRNINGDSMWIESSAPAGSNWVFMLKPDGTYYGASVTSVTWDSIPGAWDSVKVITLQKYDPTSTPVFSMWNGAEIRIGRNTGLVKAVDFFNFDWIPSDISCTLAGITNPEAGVQIPGPRELYDFQVGDIFQYSTTSHLTFSGGESMIDTVYTQYTVLSRYDSPGADSILYSMKKESWAHGIDYAPPAPPHDTIILSTDTVESLLAVHGYSMPVNSLEIERNLPGQANTDFADPVSGGYFPAEPWVMNNTWSETSKYNSRIQRNYHIWFLSSAGDTCLTTPIIFGSYGFSTYADGLGFVYASFDDVMNTWEDKMTCYTKGSETWGACMDFSILMSRNEISSSLKKATVYPNPASDFIRVELPESAGTAQYGMKIINLHGQVMKEGTVSVGEKISVSDLPEGIYMLCLTGTSGVIFHTKIEVLR